MTGCETELETLRLLRDIPGVSLRVAGCGEDVFATDMGFANKAAETPLGPAHRFRLGCLTKPIVAHAVLDLLFENGSGPEAKLAEILPELTGNAALRGMTVGHLLSHASGLPRGRYRFAPAAPARGLAPFRSLQPLFAPGTGYKYSNLGFQLVGEVIRGLSGRSPEEHVRAAILAPLGMSDTSFDEEARLATGYWKGWRFGAADLSIPSQRCPDVPLPACAGGLVATPGDMMRWLDCLVDPSAAGMRPETRRALVARIGRKPGGKATGYGLYSERIGAHLVHYFPGTTGGFSGIIFMIEALRLVALGMSNHTTANDVLRAMLDIVVSRTGVAGGTVRLQKPARVADEGCALLGKHSYRLAVDTDRRFALDRGDGFRVPLLPQSARAFFQMAGPNRRHMFRLRYHRGAISHATIGESVLVPARARLSPPRRARQDVELARLAGRYGYPPFGNADILCRGGQLYAVFGAVYETRLDRVGDRLYVNRSGPFRQERLRFVCDAAGAAQAFDLAGMNFDWRGPLDTVEV